MAAYARKTTTKKCVLVPQVTKDLAVNFQLAANLESRSMREVASDVPVCRVTLEKNVTGTCVGNTVKMGALVL